MDGVDYLGALPHSLYRIPLTGSGTEGFKRRMARKKKQAPGARLPQKRLHKAPWNRQLLTKLDLPVETDATVPKLTMVGRGDLLVENHTGVLQYDSAHIRLTTHEGVLEIKGTGLQLLELSTGRAYVRGMIAQIGYEE